MFVVQTGSVDNDGRGEEEQPANGVAGLARGRGGLLTARLELEPLRVEHAPEMAPLLDDARLHLFTGGCPGTLEDLRVRYARQVVGRSPDGRQRWLNWVARQRSDGAAVGIIQATVTDDDRTAELAWTIAVAFQRRGYAREAACSQSELLMRQSFPAPARSACSGGSRRAWRT